MQVCCVCSPKYEATYRGVLTTYACRMFCTDTDHEWGQENGGFVTPDGRGSPSQSSCTGVSLSLDYAYAWQPSLFLQASTKNSKGLCPTLSLCVCAAEF